MQKVLVVEDSDTTRNLIVSTIEDIGGLEVIDAPNAFEALRLLPRHRFSLIVTDINMPDINGLELVSFVRKNISYKGIPLIIVSTEGSDRDIKRGIELGANDYIVKPFEPSMLQESVKSLLP